MTGIIENESELWLFGSYQFSIPDRDISKKSLANAFKTAKSRGTIVVLEDENKLIYKDKPYTPPLS